MYRLARIIFTFYCFIFNRFRVYGRENVPENGPVILYANHQSMFDVFTLNIAIKRKIFFMAKKSLFSVPVIGWVVKKYGAFPVDRDNTDISAIKNSLRVIKNGDILGIFPEGTRVRDGKTVNKRKKNDGSSDTTPDIKGGFSMIAYKSKAPLLPVKIVYKRMFFLFNDIKVYIGEPIYQSEAELGDKSHDAYATAGRSLMTRLYALGEEKNVADI